MTQEEKDLLLKDLCSRLPYGVKVNVKGVVYDNRICYLTDIHYGLDTYIAVHDGMQYDIESINPYLFPLSNMTEEQYNFLYESGILNNCSHSYEYVNSYIHGVSFVFKEFKTYSLELIEWLNKNHFDYRGLIPMGLAIDATELHIY